MNRSLNREYSSSKTFGIDFGTTNTRIAYFDGEKVIPVSAREGSRTTTQIPSAVAYQNGRPVAFGNEAIKVGEQGGVIVVKSIKWLMDRADPIDVGGYLVPPSRIATDFFNYLKSVVKEAQLSEKELKRAAITVPVNYTYRARKNLSQAIEDAEIEVQAVYHEPIAALYCAMGLRRDPGLAAVFDWGGGTLDVATVRFEEDWAQVLALDGMKLGGDDFDKMILYKVISDFFQKNPDIPLTPEDLIEHPSRGFTLKKLVEEAKIYLSKSDSSDISRMNLIGSKSLMYTLNRKTFETWISFDVERGVASLKRAIRAAQVPEALLNYVLMSGGTCNIPTVQLRMKQEFGADRTTTALPSISGRNNDIANATAMGAAQLAVSGAYSVFARDIGIRMADFNQAEDLFYPVFKQGDQIKYGQSYTETLFVSNASSGVARLLICDRIDDGLNSAGRLLRILTVPIDKKENRIEVTFTVNKDLALQINATGVLAKSKERESSCVLTNIHIGFRLPERKRVREKNVIQSIN